MLWNTYLYIVGVCLVIMNEQHRIRQESIDQVIKLLEKYKDGISKEDKEKLLMAIMFKFSIARRTAYEYLDVAMFKSKIRLLK